MVQHIDNDARRAVQRLHGAACEIRPWDQDDDDEARNVARLRARWTATTVKLANAIDADGTDGHPTEAEKRDAGRTAFVELRQTLRSSEGATQAHRHLHATREAAKDLMRTLRERFKLRDDATEPRTELKPWPAANRNATADGVVTIHLTTATEIADVSEGNTGPALDPTTLAQATVDLCRTGLCQHPTAGYGDSRDCRDVALWVVRGPHGTRVVRIDHSKWGMTYTDRTRREHQEIAYWNRRLINDHDPQAIERRLAQWATHALNDKPKRRLTGTIDGAYTPTEGEALFGDAGNGEPTATA